MKTYKLISPEGEVTEVEANNLQHACQIANLRGRDEHVDFNDTDDDEPMDMSGHVPPSIPRGNVQLVTRQGFEAMAEDLEDVRFIAYAAAAVAGLLLLKELFRK